MCRQCTNTIDSVAEETGVDVGTVERIYMSASNADIIEKVMSGEMERPTMGEVVERVSAELRLPKHMVGFVYLAILRDVASVNAQEMQDVLEEVLSGSIPFEPHGVPEGPGLN